tara:strand:- start:90865 stop:91872 length:1008 start_codon:yes stop_codon:yes gene_type:complete
MSQATSPLRSYAFRSEREPHWLELEELVERVGKKGVGVLSASELARLPVLYRSALSSLSVARSISLDKNLVEYLESLCARSYLCVYGNKRHLREALWGYFFVSLPRAVRALKWPLLISAACMALGVITAYLLVSQDTDFFYTFVPNDYAGGRTPAASTEFLRSALYDNDHEASHLSEFAGFLFSHNARIGMMAFALGFAFGIPVLYLMFTNGLTLGAFLALYGDRDLGLELWAWLLPHGVTELFAVILCGAGGLALANALIFPGRHRRLQNLAIGGRVAGTAVLGAVIMLFIAGLIEGVFRQTVTSVPWRWTVVGVTATFWLYYFLWVGRGGQHE